LIINIIIGFLSRLKKAGMTHPKDHMYKAE